jgi:hypothetical protein
VTAQSAVHDPEQPQWLAYECVRFCPTNPVNYYLPAPPSPTTTKGAQ